MTVFSKRLLRSACLFFVSFFFFLWTPKVWAKSALNVIFLSETNNGALIPSKELDKIFPENDTVFSSFSRAEMALTLKFNRIPMTGYFSAKNITELFEKSERHFGSHLIVISRQVGPWTILMREGATVVEKKSPPLKLRNDAENPRSWLAKALGFNAVVTSTHSKGIEVELLTPVPLQALGVVFDSSNTTNAAPGRLPASFLVQLLKVSDAGKNAQARIVFPLQKSGESIEIGEKVSFESR